MATQNFSKMTSKKLNALLETASAEDAAEIRAILEARTTKTVPTAEPDAAPAGNEEAPATENSKMSDIERAQLVKDLREKYLNHKCQVVPFNTIEWVDGTIVGVIDDKRSSKALFAIKTDDGRRLVKAYNSKLICITEEVAEPVKRTRTRANNTEKVNPEDWDINAAMEANLSNVGKLIAVGSETKVDEDGNEITAPVYGRVVALVPDKRSCRILLRVEVPAPTEEDPKAKKTMHKTSSEDLELVADEATEKANAIYVERYSNRAIKQVVTPADRVVKCEENLKKAEENLARAQALVESRKKQLEEARLELKNSECGDSDANAESGDDLAE